MEIEKKNNKVCAVVVTYNRKKLLIECLNAILDQSYQVENIILIDNASTDGTEQALKEKGLLDNPVLEYVRMDTNLGGAGGFYEGIKLAAGKDYDWIWIMDDDTIPTASCLSELLIADSYIRGDGGFTNRKENKFSSFYASAIYGINGETINVPTINEKKSPTAGAYWYQYLKLGMVSIRKATFVSLLIRKKAINKCGLPCKDYFIWGDDSEYTERLTSYYGDAYFVGKSVAIHKRNLTNINNVIYNETNPNRLKMYSYSFRNRFINERYYHNRSYAVVIAQLMYSIIYFIIHSMSSIGRKRGIAMIKGYWDGLTQYKKFKNYIDNQIKNE